MSASGPRAAGRGQPERGAVLVEFALVLVVFAAMFFGMLQFGLLFAGDDQMRNRVQTAARMVATGSFADRPVDCGIARDYALATQRVVCGVLDLMGRPLGASGQVSVAVEFSKATGAAWAVTVCAGAPVQSLGALGGDALAAESTMYLEQAAPPVAGDFNPVLPGAPDGLPACGRATTGAAGGPVPGVGDDSPARGRAG